MGFPNGATTSEKGYYEYKGAENNKAIRRHIHIYFIKWSNNVIIFQQECKSNGYQRDAA